MGLNDIKLTMTPEAIDKLNVMAKEYQKTGWNIEQQFKDFPKGEYTLQFGSERGWQYTKLVIDNARNMKFDFVWGKKKCPLYPAPFSVSGLKALKEFETALPNVMKELETKLFS